MVLQLRVSLKSAGSLKLAAFTCNCSLYVSVLLYTNRRSIYVKGAVSRNSTKLGNYKMPVKLRETYKKPLKTLKEG